MHRLTAHLALIAYLIGGWLLPVTHQHGHDHAGGGADCCVIDVAAEQLTHDDCYCGVESVVLLAVSDQQLTGGHTSTECSGLCALCSAVNLIGDVSCGPAIEFSLLATGESLMQSGLLWPLPPLSGGVSSRGPPTV